MQDDNEHQHEDTTLAQLLRRTLAQSESYLSNPPSYAPSSSSSSAYTDQPASSSSTSASASTSSSAPPTLTTLLSNLSLCSSLISHLALLSDNETLSDLSTASLPCLLVPYYTGMLDLQSRTKDYKTRIQVLNRSKAQLESFIEKCNQYEVISEEKRKELSLASRGLPSDPMSRRDAKIKQYKEEKALKAKMETLEQRQRARAARPSATTSAHQAGNDDEEDEEDEDVLRSLYITQILSCYMKAFNELNSISNEIELLASMPNMSELPSSSSSSSSRLDPRQRQREEEDAQWRLDSTSRNLTSPATPSQLLDSSGRVLRPFTILPSSNIAGSSSNNIDTRLRLQNSVFGPGHNLPSMSIDEYLDLEYQRGNILKGGGPSNSTEVQQERDDKKAYDEEEDNMQGEFRRDQKRIKDLEDDEYRDSHKRGEGNRMNMG